MNYILIISIFIILKLNQSNITYENYINFFYDFKEYYLKNMNNIDIFNFRNYNSKIEVMIYKKQIFNEDFLWRSFVHLNYILTDKQFKESLFLMIYGLLNIKNTDISKIKNDFNFNQNFDFKRYIIKYWINNFFEKINIRHPVLINQSNEFVYRIENKDLINLNTYNMVFEFIKHCENIVFTVNKFNFFLKNLNFNKKYEILNNVNLISNDNDSNNSFNLIIFYELDLGKVIKKGFHDKIYNYNEQIVKCNMDPITI